MLKFAHVKMAFGELRGAYMQCKYNSDCIKLACIYFPNSCREKWRGKERRRQTDRERDFFNYFCVHCADRLTQTTCPLHINTKSSQLQVAVSQ